MLTGLKNTLLITAGALVIGIVIGVVIASIRSSFDKNKESLKMSGGYKKAAECIHELLN